MTTQRQAVAGLVLSATAFTGMLVFEGYRKQAYDDGVGVQTVGFGTTAGVKAGDTITVERALVRALGDAGKIEQELKACLPDVRLYQHEWDAVVSWAYNVGSGAACRSTLAKKAKAGDYAGMCAELSRWTFAGGKQLPGLVKRRADERAMCEGKRG